MKKIKVSIIAVIAIFLGIAVSAFTEIMPDKQKNTVVHYFEFTGSSNSDVGIQGNWDDLGTEPPALSCSEINGIVCYVEYEGDLTSFQAYVNGKTLAQLEGDQIIKAYREE